MDIKIHAQGMKLTESLEDHIRERVDRLDKFADRTIDAKFELRASKPRSGGEHVRAQFTIHTPGNILRAETSNHDARAAIDQTVDKMKRQVRRYNSKRVQRSRQRAQNLGRFAAEQEDLFNDVEEDEAAPVVRRKRFEMIPVDVEEAIEQMELLEHDFFVFRNRDSGEVNVVYRREDNAYGVIEPDVS
ncbi:MAG: ribosome hibernation-promoting factor, HPF/YfiA family [Chloroflexota bacterium]